jgi:hypothetical protein
MQLASACSVSVLLVLLQRGLMLHRGRMQFDPVEAAVRAIIQQSALSAGACVAWDQQPWAFFPSASTA